MRKFVKKLVCFTVCVSTAVGVSLSAGCQGYHNATALSGDWSTGEVVSNGGFAVEKGNYIYFVNGVESYSATNTYGKPVKGALMRISTQDFARRNYQSVETVVPQVIYSGSYSSGIYIYGDKIYYTTPSTSKDSDGNVLNTNLEFKSAQLDGTKAMSNTYYTAEDNAIDYRFVEVDGIVYLMYAASEDLFETGSAVTNIHSVNTETGADTLLAYGVSSYVFDSKDVENPNVYYTMAVNVYLGTDNAYKANYNQIYKVSADDVTANEYNFDYLGDDYDAEVNPLYVNYGDLVFDGIGVGDHVTQFNGVSSDYEVSNPSYTYALSSYQSIEKSGVKVPTLFYTRVPTGESTSQLFSITDTQTESFLNDTTVNAVEFNPDASQCLLQDATDASSYQYVNINGTDKIININSSGSILIGVAENGVIAETGENAMFPLPTTSGTPSILFTQTGADNHLYLYYSIAGENVYRIAIDGKKSDYREMPTDDDVTYSEVKILEIDTKAEWFAPEFIQGQLLYASDVDTMANYSYIEVCDLRNANGNEMTNAEIEELNDLYKEVQNKIDSFDTSDYENLANALKYAYYACDGDYDYLQEVIDASVKYGNKDNDDVYTEESQAIYWDFVNHTENQTSVWAEYKTKTRTVNGVEVAANRKDYYYCLLGEMNETDAEQYVQDIKDSYVYALTEDTSTWWQGLSTVAKVFFIIGVSVGGLLILGCIALGVIMLVKKNKSKAPEYKKAKVKVDTTDDKNINVYENDEDGENAE